MNQNVQVRVSCLGCLFWCVLPSVLIILAVRAL